MAVYRDSYDIRVGKIPLYRSMNAIKNFIVPNKRLPFIYVDMHNILMIKKQLDENVDLAKAYVNSGKEFVRDYLSEEPKMRYIEELFEEVNNKISPTCPASH